MTARLARPKRRGLEGCFYLNRWALGHWAESAGVTRAVLASRNKAVGEMDLGPTPQFISQTAPLTRSPDQPSLSSASLLVCASLQPRSAPLRPRLTIHVDPRRSLHCLHCPGLSPSLPYPCLSTNHASVQPSLTASLSNAPLLSYFASLLFAACRMCNQPTRRQGYSTGMSLLWQLYCKSTHNTPLQSPPDT